MYRYHNSDVVISSQSVNLSQHATFDESETTDAHVLVVLNKHIHISTIFHKELTDDSA